MIEMQPLNEAALAREMLRQLSDPKSALIRAASVLELVAHGSVGLGEVLQDYAAQDYAQIQEIIHAAKNAGSGITLHSHDREALQNIHYTLKAIKCVLEMIPTAMLRNKSDILGEKERLSRADIAEITHAFLHSPAIVRLLADEQAGEIMAALMDKTDGALIPSDAQPVPVAASH